MRRLEPPQRRGSPDGGPGRIVHVTWSGGIGGIERFVLDLATAQADSGPPPAVALGQARGPFAGALREAGLEVMDIGLRSGYDLRPLPLGNLVRRLARADLVHLHGFNVPLALACVVARRPVVFTEHGNFGLYRHVGRAERLKRRLQRGFLDKGCAAVVANSDHTLQGLVRTYRLKGPRLATIHNGIAPIRQEVGIRQPTEPLHVAYIGRLVRHKRIDRLLRAIAHIAPSRAVTVSVIGDGPAGEELRSLARRLGVDARVEFLGARENAVDLMDQIDIVVQPSEREAFGLAVLEACARGALPIVFSDGGGVLEILPPDGLTIETPEELAAALEGAIGSPLVSADARRARATWARQEFSIERTANAYAEVYRTVSRSR